MKKGWGIGWLGWTPLAWYLFFLLGPLGLIALTGFATRGTYGGIRWDLNIGNFARALDPLYFQILVSSFVLSLETSFICLAIGFPVALVMSTLSHRIRSAVIFLLAIPFLTNLMIRLCALKAFTAYEGPLDLLLNFFSVPHDSFLLSQNLPLVLFGMVSTYLPFMIFPIYGALERFDFSLVEAAQDLGATYIQVLWRVVVPGLRKPLASGFLLVFIPAMGEFLIPDILGGAKVMLTGNLISEQFLKARDWPFGSALAVIMMVILFISIFLIQKTEGSVGHE